MLRKLLHAEKEEWGKDALYRFVRWLLGTRGQACKNEHVSFMQTLGSRAVGKHHTCKAYTYVSKPPLSTENLEELERSVVVLIARPFWALHNDTMVDNWQNLSADDPNDLKSATNVSLSDAPDALTPICNIVTPVGMLGYGLHEDQTAAALITKQRNGAPTAIILDSGSTDSGPEKLALGCMSVPRDSYARDLRKLLKLAWNVRVPLIFSSAGGDGSDEHVRELLGVVEDISRDEYGPLSLSMRGECCSQSPDATASRQLPYFPASTKLWSRNA
jgi:hypothetical protein